MKVIIFSITEIYEINYIVTFFFPIEEVNLDTSLQVVIENFVSLLKRTALNV